MINTRILIALILSDVGCTETLNLAGNWDVYMKPDFKGALRLNTARSVRWDGH